MKPKTQILALVCIAFPAIIGGAAVAAPTSLWSHGDPSAEEQYAIEQLNAARKDPVAYATRYYGQNNADPTVTGYVAFQSGAADRPAAQTAWIQRTLADLQATYLTIQKDSAASPNTLGISNEPVVFYPALQQQAALWNGKTTPPVVAPTRVVGSATYTLPSAIFPVPFFTPQNTAADAGGIPEYKPSVPFSGPNATGGTAVFGPYGGTYYDTFSANLYIPQVSAREWALGYVSSTNLLGVLLSQGDPLPSGMGHTRMVGIKIRAGTENNRVLTLFKASSEFFTTSDLPFGAANTVFITGVVYQDKNSNGVYDIGEGLAGATIVPDKGSWYAVSSTSGGFAIPVQANSGAYTLTVTTGRLQGSTAAVTVAGGSVKVDWSLPADSGVLPVQVPVGNPTGATQLTGLSTRGLVETGANALFGGFVITSNTTATKRVLIRGVGPTLDFAFGIHEAIPATTLDIYNSAGALIASNTKWRTNADGGAAVSAAATSVGDFAFVTDFDSAVVLDLPAGGYTAVVRPPDGTPAAYQSGYVGLLEVYDLTPTVGGRFVDVSTRARVSTGIRQMIVGCTVTGSGLKRVLIRGVGLELATAFGVPGVLPNPTLTLFDNAGATLATNDDWSNSEQTTQIRSLASASGAFPLTEGSPDASLLRLLAPGNYTAAVAGKTGTLNNGVAIVELYETP